MGETWGGGPRGIRRLRRACFQFRITKWTLETSSKLARGDIGAVARLGPSSLFFLLLRGGRSRTLRARARFVPPLVLREVTHSLKLESHRLSSSKVFEVAKNRHQRREHSQTDNGFPQTPYGPSKLARVDFFSPSCLLRFCSKRFPKSHKKSLESTKSPSRRQPTRIVRHAMLPVCPCSGVPQKGASLYDERTPTLAIRQVVGSE